MENFQLRPYQTAHLAFHLSHDRSLNLSHPGTGKTPTACLYMNYLVREKKARIAFVMPNSLILKNYQELLKFTDFKPEEIAVILNTKPEKREEMYADYSKKVYIMGFSIFAKEWMRFRRNEEGGWGCIIDELHMGYKTNKSQRVQNLYKAMNYMKYFLGMTGTLIDGRLDSAYPAIRIVNPGYYASYDSFLRQHASYDFDGRINGWTNHKKIAQILGKIAVGITFQEAYKDSPKPVLIHQVCQISPEHKKFYKEMEEDALIELEDGYLDATENPGVKQMRCRQILEAPESIELKADFELGKDEALKVFLEDAINNKKPLIIFSVFKAEQERLKKLCDTYGLTTKVLNGETPNKERGRIDEDFRAGKIDIVIGSPEVMSVGFNWQHVDTVIFVSLNYKDSDFKQAIQRADRGTRTYPLRVIRLYYDVAVEHRLWQIIRRKQKDTELVGW